MKGEQYSAIMRYAALLALFAGIASGFGCNPFYFNSPIPTVQNCPSNTMTIGGDPTRTQVDVDIYYCGQATSTILKGFIISATATPGDYFEYSMWHEENDVKCTFDIGYDNGAGGYYLLKDANVLDQNGLYNDPTKSTMPFFTFKKWYTRRFYFPNDFTGKQLAIVFACNVAAANIGSRTWFVRDVSIKAGNGALRSQIDVTCAGVSCGPSCAQSSGACHDIGSSMFCSCSDGYTGADCGSAICAVGCVNGGCNTPGDCVCNPALWTGTLCDVPVCATGCKNGTCSQPGSCECNAGWQGSLCDSAICSPTCNVAGATCNLPGECNCNDGWSGKDCNETICKQGCQRGTCQKAGECNCLSGWQGDLCDSYFCTVCSTQGGACTGPNECTCNKGYSGEACDTYCTLPKPVDLADCTVVDGSSVWVVNGSLTVNSTTTVNNIVIVYGDLEVTDFGQLVVNGSTVLSVYGCLDIKNQSSLAVSLTDEEIEQLKNDGKLNRTVITFGVLCDTPNDFGIVSVTNSGQIPCSIIQADQTTGPGILSVLFSTEQVACNNETPTSDLIGGNTGGLLDWQLAVIIVACVVVAGGAITAGILIRKRMLDKELKAVGSNSY